MYTDLQNFYTCSIVNTPSHAISSNLRSLQIHTINNIPFHQIESLFQKPFHQLKTLKFCFKTVVLSQSSLDYIDDQRWQAILQSLDSLEQFHCCLELPVQSESISKSFEQNEYFRQRNWKFSTEVYTYSFNTMLRIYTQPYPRRQRDIIPSKVFVHDNNAYSCVRDLRILIDAIGMIAVNSIAEIIYPNVTSLTLIGNKSFDEQTFLLYLYSIIDRRQLRYLIVQLDNCSKSFLSNLMENCPKLSSLTISTYQSWSKLIGLSSKLAQSSIRSLVVYEVFIDFNQYKTMYQLFNRLEMISVAISSTENCYRLLTLLFIGNGRNTLEKLRSLTIKCDFDEPDAMANWVRANILRKLSYKCTTSVLIIWL